MCTAVVPALRHVSRLCPRRPSVFRSLNPVVASPAYHTTQKRCYVSASKKDSATVNVETTIKADQKAFLRQTGTAAEDAIMPLTGMSADAMLSPAAGSLLQLIGCNMIINAARYSKASDGNGRGHPSHLP